MRIVVDKKIKKTDGEVERLLNTDQLIQEADSIRTIERTLDETEAFSVNGLTGDGFQYILLESDIIVSVKVQSTGSYVVNGIASKRFEFCGIVTAATLTITNTNEEQKAKIKLVLVG